MEYELQLWLTFKSTSSSDLSHDCTRVPTLKLLFPSSKLFSSRRQQSMHTALQKMLHIYSQNSKSSLCVVQYKYIDTKQLRKLVVIHFACQDFPNQLVHWRKGVTWKSTWVLLKPPVCHWPKAHYFPSQLPDLFSSAYELSGFRVMKWKLSKCLTFCHSKKSF